MMKKILMLSFLFTIAFNAISEEVITKSIYKGSFIVNGDKNKYYPVVFRYSNANRINHIKISRAYSESGPTELSPTHKGALTLDLEVNFGSWGGAAFDWRIMDLRQHYHETFGGAMYTMHSYGFLVFLRGGGFIYHYECDYPSNLLVADVNNLNVILYDSSDDKYDVFAPNPINEPMYGLINSHKNDHWKFIKGKPFDHRGHLGILKKASNYPLDVEGAIRATEIKVESTGGADFVFEDDYQLKDLSEVEKFITTNKHLPDIPSAKQMEENGVGLAEMNMLLLQKVEELTLYTIALEKKLQARSVQIENFKELEKRITALEENQK
ncbi:hypothetical protein DF185_22580 [Marinifilum breve]|uniref:Peptidase S74 domain-containing protein n=1 Tax=Marinifilum breve TaxID=2184082 RepID=A0A2V3ZRK6_9BACT|nr:hypothetical protein [Marinifilum breve]PXX95168.1 hypothetical protein DF185_22580 [Marinifilum breve]